MNKLKDTISVAGRDVSNKAKNVSDSVKLNGQIKSNGRMIEKLMYQLGTRYFQNHSTEEGTEYDDLFLEIRRLQSENVALEKQITDMNTEKVCAQCGVGNPVTNKFCIGCGAPLLDESQKVAAPPQKTIVCTTCGRVLPQDSVFCVECGAKVKDAQADESSEVVGE